jgi:hypothetical protein
MSHHASHTLLLIGTLTIMQPAHAETPANILAGFEQQARQGSPDFKGFSSARGGQFFKSIHGNDWSCATCHTEHPIGPGKHAKTGKVIQPLAPAANAKRFSDPAKVEKWFKRNCNDVLARSCTALEKGDVLTYLLSLK